MLQDVRYGVRALARTPGFTLVACLTLALTIGAVSTVLTIVDTLLYRALPVEDAEQVVEVAVSSDHGRDLDPISYPDYVHFRDRTQTLASLAAHYPTAPLFVTSGESAREINGSVVSVNYFPLLGIRPALGRFFRPDEDEVPLRDRVAVISHELWRSQFGGSPDVLGETLTINGETFAIVGVTPASFRGIRESPSQIYIPTMTLPIGYRWCEDALSTECTTLRMVARLTDGRSVDDARAELTTLMPAHWAQLPEEDRPTGIAVEHRRGAVDSEENRRLARLLIGVAIALLLVCAANLAGLSISRGNARVRELAIRTSLGATWGRLLRQLLIESSMLALAGGALGVLLSIQLTGALNTLFYTADYAGRPLYFDFSLAPATVLGVLAVSLSTGVLFGILPALRMIVASRTGTAATLKREATAVVGSSRTTRWLVGAQAAAATALVAIAALLATSAESLVDGLNFDSSQVALLRLRPRLVGYPPERAQAFTQEALRRLAARPDVASVSAVGTGASLAGFRTEVQRRGDAPESHRVGYIEVTPGYFETLSVPLLVGRDFDGRDTADSRPVTIVSQALAQELWPEGDAVGSTLVLGDETHDVVGIVADVPLQSRDAPLQPYVYRSYWQNPRRIDARVQVKVTGDPAIALPELVREVHSIDPEVPIANVVTLAHNMGGRFRQLRMSAVVVAYAGGLVLLLSAIGLYGALAFSVGRRTREIGVRMAIGARPGEVQRSVVLDGMRTVALGATVGVALGVAGVRLLRHTLYGSSAGDPGFLAAAALAVAIVGLVATWLPSRRAAAVDPLVALRAE